MLFKSQKIRNATVAILLIIIAVLLIIYYPRKTEQKDSNTSSDMQEIKSSSEILDESQNIPGTNSDQKDKTTATPQPEVKVDNHDPYSLYNASDVKYLSGDYNTALSLINDAILLKIDEALFYNKKAEILIKLGKKNEAISTVESGLSILPGNELLKNKLEVIQNVPS